MAARSSSCPATGYLVARKRMGLNSRDETAAEGDNIPPENQLSLELEVPPVAMESTAASAVVEQRKQFLRDGAKS